MRTLIAGNQPVFTDALAGFLKGLRPENEVAMATSLADATDHICAREVDLVVVDLGLPGMTGLASIVELINMAGTARVVVVADGHPQSTHHHSRICGVAGLIEKTASPHQIERTLTMVLRGGLAFPDTLAIPTATMAANTNAALTPRQLNVLELLTGGMSNKQIAKDLDLSPNTVKAHVSEILRRLGVSTRTEAIVLTRQPWVQQVPAA